VEGFYLRNKEVDEQIGKKKVKCSMKTCTWSGPLKQLGSHQHTTYATSKKTQFNTSTGLPRLNSTENLSGGKKITALLPRRHTFGSNTGGTAGAGSRIPLAVSANSSTTTGNNATSSDTELSSSTGGTTTAAPRVPRPPAAPRTQGQ
jgi:hypothetical protein